MPNRELGTASTRSLDVVRRRRRLALAFHLMLVVVCAAISSCRTNRDVIERATVTNNGTLRVNQLDREWEVEGIVVRFDACRDQGVMVPFVQLDSAATAPPSFVTCLRALAVGTKIDVTLAVAAVPGGVSRVPTRIGPCVVPARVNAFMQTTGPSVCAWSQ